jgi:hypothetical protein
MYNLYLDDERTPKNETPFFIVRNYEDFKYTIMENGIPSYISFDHDLGDTKTGYDCANWLQCYVIMNGVKIPYNFNYNVHSANPVGVKRIVDCIESLLRMVKNDS